MPGCGKRPGSAGAAAGAAERLADRMRPPWWYLAGIGILWALTFAAPFSSRFLPPGSPWPILVAVVAVAYLLQWGMARVTGIVVATGSSAFPRAVPQ